MFKTFLTNSLVILLLCAGNIAMAEESSASQQRWYQVELIFFERLNPLATGEVWPVQEDADQRSASARTLGAAGRAGAKTRAFQRLNPADFSMTDISKKISGSRQYRMLSHVAWRQPTVEKARSQAVHVFKERRFDGTVKVSLARYLHLDADISYFNPDVYLGEQIAQNNNNASTIEHFKLKQSRRMRSKEVHYLDHPYFGIIAKITPYKP